MRVLFFIPSFNDQQLLPGMVESLLATCPNSTVLIVDDGSEPNIALTLDDPVNQKRVTLIRLDFNVGLGLATSIAIDQFLREDYNAFIRLDADGQHPVCQVQAMLTAIDINSADVVWGERSNHLTNENFRQLLGSLTKQATAWVGRKIFNTKIEDWFTGFYALNRTAAHCAANAYLERYCEVQLLCIFHENKLRITTHSVEQLERKHGVSRIRLLDGVMIFLRSVIIMLLYALRMHPR